MAALLADKAALIAVLTYHVVPGNVVMTDIEASKGVIHVIDTVIMPNS